MEYLLDESGLQKLVDLLADGAPLLLVEASKALLDRLGVGQDIKGVLGDLPRDARHVRGAPREDVGVGAEKVDEHHFLFAVEGGADLQRPPLGILGVEGYVFGAFSSLEGARALLRRILGQLGHLLQLCG